MPHDKPRKSGAAFLKHQSTQFSSTSEKPGSDGQGGSSNEEPGSLGMPWNARLLIANPESPKDLGLLRDTLFESLKAVPERLHSSYRRFAEPANSSYFSTM